MGGKELKVISARQGFDCTRLSYFHPMQHAFKITLDDPGASSEISEALSGRRYASAGAERYEHLRRNHRCLSTNDAACGLNAVAALLDKISGT